VLRPSILIKSIKSIQKKEECEGDISVFASLCTALSATLGTGSIVGMAVAVVLGGSGALFWVWVSAIFGLGIKYAEGFLAIRYRKVGADGKIAGGPMYYIEAGIRGKLGKCVARAFAVSNVIVALIGTGTLAQSNSIAVAMTSFGVPIWASAVVVCVGVTTVICGGLKKIARVSEKLVPIMTVFYVGSALIVLVLNFAKIPHVFEMVFKGAFCPESILGGGAGGGITVGQIMGIGISRGLFSHEAGLGSSAIAAASSKTSSPTRQGLASMSAVIFSIIICTMTCLVLIVTSDATGIFVSGTASQGLELTSNAFGVGLGMPELGRYVVSVGIVLFAFTTIIGWCYYGEKCTQYAMGDRFITPYKLLFVAFVAAGPFFDIKMAFAIADIVIGCMAISNIVGVVSLRRAVEIRKDGGG
jgi:AGCS family alanine or glycine:cation symporter